MSRQEFKEGPPHGSGVERTSMALFEGGNESNDRFRIEELSAPHDSIAGQDHRRAARDWISRKQDGDTREESERKQNCAQ